MANYSDVDLHEIARDTIRQYGFDFTIKKPVAGEVAAIDGKKLLSKAGKDVKDLRSLLWSSIDNITSLDLDQLEYCERGIKGEIIVRVAVADVDLYVPKRSKTDVYAARNCTSVYTGIDVFPMLPLRLSADLSSLLPGPDHAAIVIEFSVSPDGSTISGCIYRALVKNKAKLVYEEIGAWLEGKSGVPAPVSKVAGLKEQLLLQDEAARLLNKFRAEHGALDLGPIEAKVIVKDDQVVSLVAEQKTRAHSVIENFMINANITMSQYLRNAGLPMIQRVVCVPKNWQGIVDLAADLNEKLPPKPDARALARFLEKRKTADLESFPDLSLTVVKLLGPGEYIMIKPEESSVGHFGLAITDYTHGTAPNRRYVDEVIQRLLKAALDRKPCPYSQKELTDHAARCSDRDKAAKKVSRFMRKAAAAVLLSGRVGETFDAIVTGASEKGTYARLLTVPAEGRVMRGERGLFIGQRVHVRLIGMDPYMGHIDFEKCR